MGTVWLPHATGLPGDGLYPSVEGLLLIYHPLVCPQQQVASAFRRSICQRQRHHCLCNIHKLHLDPLELCHPGRRMLARCYTQEPPRRFVDPRLEQDCLCVGGTTTIVRAMVAMMSLIICTGCLAGWGSVPSARCSTAIPAWPCDIVPPLSPLHCLGLLPGLA